MLHYTAFGEVKKINKNINKKSNTKKRIIEGMADTTSRSIEDFAYDCGIQPTDIENYKNRTDINQDDPENLQIPVSGIGKIYQDVSQGMNLTAYGPVVQKCMQDAIEGMESVDSNDESPDTTTDGSTNEATATNEETVEATATATNQATNEATATNESTATNEATVESTKEATGTIMKTASSDTITNEMNQVQPYSTDLKTLQIDGNLTMAGQINANSYGNILIGADGKICIGDACLNKDNIEKLMQMLNQ